MPVLQYYFIIVIYKMNAWFILKFKTLNVEKLRL